MQNYELLHVFLLIPTEAEPCKLRPELQYAPFSAERTEWVGNLTTGLQLRQKRRDDLAETENTSEKALQQSLSHCNLFARELYLGGRSWKNRQHEFDTTTIKSDCYERL